MLQVLGVSAVFATSTLAPFFFFISAAGRWILDIICVLFWYISNVS